jgi:hypothetical protein
MRRALWILGLVTAACLPGCGDDEGAGADPALWVARADEAFEAANESARRAREPGPLGSDARTPDHWADAAASWKEAARGYRNAFRLEDPTPDRSDARGLLAFRVGRAMSLAARKRPGDASSEGWARESLLWFRQAESIRPDLRQVHYERALLYESEVPGLRDMERARMGYEAYLAALDGVDVVPDGESIMVERARKRLEELTPPSPK